MLPKGMAEDRTPAPKRLTGDRPRRRDIALTASIGLSVMLVLTLAGELSAGAFLGGSLAFIALGLIYYLTALTTAEPRPRPATVNTPRDLEGEASVTMLERLPIPVLLIGAGGRIERANPAARTFLGLGSERGLLSTVLRQPRVLEAVSAALRGDRGATVEYSTLAPLESHVRAFVEPIRLSAPGCRFAPCWCWPTTPTPSAPNGCAQIFWPMPVTNCARRSPHWRALSKPCPARRGTMKKPETGSWAS